VDRRRCRLTLDAVRREAMTITGALVGLLLALAYLLGVVAVVVVAFAIGAIPFGVIVARRKGVDIKAHGSGNIGATNVTRVLGPLAGGVVLVLDAGKGAAAAAIASYVGGPWLAVAGGFAAVLGHCFSPALGGKGGKGVATALGVFAFMSPPLAAAAVLVFGASLLATKVPALASLSAVTVVALVCVQGEDVPMIVLSCATLLLLVYTHRANLAKLWT
jgi:acyl phosphate:glycerol-3-phosphate acyltransferase